MNALSYQYIRLLIRDSSKYFQQKSYLESKKLNYIHGIAESVSNQSGIYGLFDNDLINSETLARESIAWFEKTDNKNNIGVAYHNLFFAVFGQSKFDTALRMSEREYASGLKEKDTAIMHNKLADIGVIHFQEGNYDSAWHYY